MVPTGGVPWHPRGTSLVHEHLKRQARAAERWQAYKNEQKKKEAELKALSLREAQAVVANYTLELRKAELSIDAGSYLCNAVFYRALAATAGAKRAPLTYFIHVPPAGGAFAMRKLISAGAAAVWAAAHETRKANSVPRRDA